MGGNFEFAGLSFDIGLPECGAFPVHHLPTRPSDLTSPKSHGGSTTV